jgi:hypothetical protein
MLAQPSNLQFTNRYTYYVYQHYSLYRCTLHIMCGYSLIMHDITLLLTTLRIIVNKQQFKVCPTPELCLLVAGQRHKRFSGVPRTIRIHQIWWRVTGLPTTLDAFNAIPTRRSRIFLLHQPLLSNILMISYWLLYSEVLD